MTKITITENSIECEGHAGYNPGNDIVCSAISMINLMTIQYLHKINAKLTYRIENGYTYIELHQGDNTALKIAETGFRMLADEYPKNVQIVDK